MKKIVFFIGGLNYGGMERVAFIAGTLLKEYYDITFVTLYQNEADYKICFPSYDICVPPSYSKLGKFIGFWRRLFGTRKMKKTLQPDVVYSFGMYSNYLNALTKGKEKIIFGIRSYDWLTNPFITEKIDKFVVRKFDKVNAVSRLIAEDASVIWGIEKSNIKVIYNPYNVEEIQRKSHDRVDDFTFENGCFYFISIGRMSNQKGFNHLIRAFYELQLNNDKVRLIIMGNGDKKDDICKMIELYQLYGKVSVLGGKSNPYKYIKESNAYVLSSHTEGFPNALVEAMCIGKPIVSVNCKSGPCEIMLDKTNCDIGDSGFIVTPYGVLSAEMNCDYSYSKKELSNEEISLKNAMEYACDYFPVDEPEIRKRAWERAREFSYEKFTREMLEEINSVFI